MNDERFFDLAMKVIARKATEAERAELDAAFGHEPKLKSEFERLQADVRIAKDALPLVDAARAATGELPAYARGRLQTKVRQTLGSPQTAANEPDRSLAWGWRWLLGLAAAAAMIVLVIPLFRPPASPVIELAMLDIAGGTRGGETNDVALLQQTWANRKLDSFTNAELLRAWESNWLAKADAVKIIYDRNAGEVRVLGRWKGTTFRQTFPVETELSDALARAREFIQDRTRP